MTALRHDPALAAGPHGHVIAKRLEAASHWYDGASLYHIYPLSFADSNGDGFGDLQGIIEHLDYLNDGTPDSLGVTALWLSPIYRSPMTDWGYDVADYRSVDPRLGTMAEFERLVEAVHARGMKLLLDFVPNHTSNDHEWFLAARRSRLSKKRDWYVWADPKPDGSPPNNWLSRFGGPAWTFDKTTGQYYLHSFLPSQPDLNWRNPEIRTAMQAVLAFWLAMGVDGFRTDAVTSLLKDQRLRDNPPNPDFIDGVSDPADRYLQVHSAMVEGLDEVLDSMCEVLDDSSGENVLMSEAYLDIKGMARLYRACDDHPVHAPFNFNLIHMPWSARAYRAFIDEYEASLRPQDMPNYVLGNHDQRRLATRLGPERARLCAVLQLTLRGLPVIYYGDELGLPDAEVTEAERRDPWRQMINGRPTGRDPERSPLPWSTERFGGFSSRQPWLPLVQDLKAYGVEGQSQKADSSLSLYRHLLFLRRQMPALARGTYGSIETGCEDIFAYNRQAGRQSVVVVLNFSDQPQSFGFEFTGRCIASTLEVDGDGSLYDGGSMWLGPYEGRVYEAVAV